MKSRHKKETKNNEFSYLFETGKLPKLELTTQSAIFRSLVRMSQRIQAMEEIIAAFMKPVLDDIDLKQKSKRSKKCLTTKKP